MEKNCSNSIDVVKNFSEWKTNGQTQLMWLKNFSEWKTNGKTQLMWLKTFQNGKKLFKLN